MCLAMDSFFVAVLIGTMPLLVLFISWMYQILGKRNSINWKWGFIAFIGVIIFYIGLAIYCKRKFGFSIFPSIFDLTISLIVAGVLLIVVGGICLFVHISFKGKDVPKSVHNPKLLPFLAIGPSLFFLYIGIIILPMDGKINFVTSYEKAVEMIDGNREDAEFSVVLAQSDKRCIRARSSSCHDDDYENLFFVKNHLEKPQEVQLIIRAYGPNEQLQKEIESTIMKLEQGEIKLVSTEETFTETSPWNQPSFETEKKIYTYEYAYRYREIK